MQLLQYMYIYVSCWSYIEYKKNDSVLTRENTVTKKLSSLDIDFTSLSLFINGFEDRIRSVTSPMLILPFHFVDSPMYVVPLHSLSVAALKAIVGQRNYYDKPHWENTSKQPKFFRYRADTDKDDDQHEKNNRQNA